MIKHSLSIRGHRTSISLEQPFWDELQKIARRQGLSVSALVTCIDADRSQKPRSGRPLAPLHGLSSAVRVFILNDVLGRKTG